MSDNGKLIVFERKFNIGHVATLLGVIIGAIVAVWTIRQSDLKAFSDMQSQQKMQEEKIETIYRELEKDRKENLQFMSDMRSSTGKFATDMAVIQALFNRIADGKR